MRFDDPVFRDTLFRQKRKGGKWREVEAPSLEGLVADTHAHLHMLPDPSLALARCAAHGVAFVCAITDPSEDADVVFCELEDWQAGAVDAISEIMSGGGFDLGASANEGAVPDAFVSDASAPKVPVVRIAAGVHPHNARLYDANMERTLRTLLHDPRVAAVGEIGLDYHYDLSPRDEQRRVFRKQIRLAKEAGLPVILHVREAHDEAFAILEEEGFPQEGTLLHCYNLDGETLRPWTERGCYVAFGGPLTFQNADEVRQAAAQVPLDRLLTETDAPYMTPEPMRGTTCGPEHVVFTAAKMLEVLDAQDGACGGDDVLRRAALAQLFANARALLDREPTAWQLSRY